MSFFLPDWIETGVTILSCCFIVVTIHNFNVPVGHMDIDVCESLRDL